MLHCGKHRGKRFVDVAKVDRPYCAWVLRDGGPAFGPFSDYLRSQHGGVMNVGKYKDQFFRDVLQQDPEYCTWAVELTDPGPALRSFIEYLQDQARDPLPKNIDGEQQDGGGEGEHTQKRRRCAAGPCQCNICCSGAAYHACIPCGHVMCGVCASKLRAGCPFCRSAIDRCVKLFLQ